MRNLTRHFQIWPSVSKIKCELSNLTVEQVKYQLVYEKRVVDPVTFKTYPFGYERLTDQDIKIVNMFVDL